MCGICGQLHLDLERPVADSLIRAMSDSIAHRGPDDSGQYLNGPIGFGFRRLSIIDLSDGHQPMTNETGRIWVVFNGEIYNYRELRRELEAHGHQFRTRSDTEVIVHGYEQWGLDMLERFNGMFGLAVWDDERRRLLLARDRAGIKPLYYNVQHGAVTFGSEIRPVRLALGGRTVPDPAALNLYLKYRYTPAPLTLFQGIRKLAAGTRLVAEGGRVRVERWWNYHPRPIEPEHSDADAEARLRELYEKALESQLMSDVPLGLLLSGGVDSSLMLALMNRHGRDWKTFTVGFGASYRDDELADAAQTARSLGAAHSPICIDRATFERTLPKIVEILEELVATASVIPMYFVCQRARQDVKVALMGQGPDELFAGYTRHLGVRYGRYWRVLPAWSAQPLARTLASFSRSETLRRGLHALGEPDRMDRYLRVFQLLPGQQINALFRDGTGEPDPDLLLREAWQELEPLMSEVDELGGLQYLEIRSSLPDELLMYGDKISMHHGLEVRVPFLDHEIIEYAERLPATMKIRRGHRKWLHRQVCRNLLPASVLSRKKRGFASTVVDDWFRDAMAGGIDQYLLDPQSRMYALLRHDRVQRLVQEHRLGREDHHKLLFSLVLFEQWMRTFAPE